MDSFFFLFLQDVGKLEALKKQKRKEKEGKRKIKIDLIICINIVDIV